MRILLAVLLLVVWGPVAWAAGGTRTSIEIILDASFTMNEQLDNGKKKLDVAKESILFLMDRMNGDASIALRVYGHLALRELQDCTDSELLVPFASVSRNRPRAARMLRSVFPRGLSPLGRVLREAVHDLSLQPGGRKIIILLADGPCSCEGDPCGVVPEGQVVVNTIGVRCSGPARVQLRCVASITGGRYFQADDGKELRRALLSAATVSGQTTPRLSGDGRVRVEGVDANTVMVKRADRRREVEFRRDGEGCIVLPAGVYTVSTGTQDWKSVVVSGGRTTVLEPGRLQVLNSTDRGHTVVEWESRRVVGTVSAGSPELILLPGDYEVMFGKAGWRARVPGARQTVLKPGIIRVENISPKGVELRALPQNTIVGDLTRKENWMPLPPGEYLVDIEGQGFPCTLVEDQLLVLNK